MVASVPYRTHTYRHKYFVVKKNDKWRDRTFPLYNHLILGQDLFASFHLFLVSALISSCMQYICFNLIRVVFPSVQCDKAETI